MRHLPAPVASAVSSSSATTCRSSARRARHPRCRFASSSRSGTSSTRNPGTILAELATGPRRIGLAIAGRGDGSLDAAPAAGEWSAREVLEHLVFAEASWRRASRGSSTRTIRTSCLGAGRGRATHRRGHGGDRRGCRGGSCRRSSWRGRRSSRRSRCWRRGSISTWELTYSDVRPRVAGVREPFAALPLRSAAGAPAGRAGRRPRRWSSRTTTSLRPVAGTSAFASTTSRSTPADKARAEAAQRAAARRAARRSGRARALHADPVAGVRRALAGAHHQHPPLVLAGVRGRQALPPGASSAA